MMLYEGIRSDQFFYSKAVNVKNYRNFPFIFIIFTYNTFKN